MGKTYKLALALLYLLQLVIVFHEQVLHLFEQVARQTASEVADHREPVQSLLDKSESPAEDQGTFPGSERIARERARHATMAATITTSKDEKHLPDHHEEKNRDDKRGRRRRIAEFLIENLFSRYKRMADPTAGTPMERHVTRFIAYPETALRQHAA